MVKDNEPSIIFLQVHRIEDIVFKSSVPLSCKRLLNEDVEEFIVEAAEDLPVKNNLTLSIKATDLSIVNDGEVAAMIHKHFAYCKEKTDKQLTNILKLGWKSLALAFVFLVAMFFLTKALVALLPEGGLMVLIRELFIILGWVALWRPADLLLYEWGPYKRKAKLFGKLAECDIHLEKATASEKEN